MENKMIDENKVKEGFYGVLDGTITSAEQFFSIENMKVPVLVQQEVEARLRNYFMNKGLDASKKEIVNVAKVLPLVFDPYMMGIVEKNYGAGCPARHTAITANYHILDNLKRGDNDYLEIKKRYPIELAKSEAYNSIGKDGFKLRSIKKELFEDADFYNDIVNRVVSNIKFKFEQATRGLEMNDELEAEFQAKMEKSLSKVARELEDYRQIALSKRAKQQAKIEKKKLIEAKKAAKGLGV